MELIRNGSTFGAGKRVWNERMDVRGPGAVKSEKCITLRNRGSVDAQDVASRIKPRTHSGPSSPPEEPNMATTNLTRPHTARWISQSHHRPCHFENEEDHEEPHVVTFWQFSHCATRACEPFQRHDHVRVPLRQAYWRFPH